MNEFRERLFSGKLAAEPLLREKRRKGSSPAEALPSAENQPEPEGSTLGDVVIPRETGRTTNHRLSDRHRLLKEEEATATWDGRDFRVQIINLSGGGTMIAAPFQPRLWDRIDLSLGGCGTLECAVRWVKGGRVGMEFAHETRIEAEPEVRTSLLREVIRRSFPDVEMDVPPVTPVDAPASGTEVAHECESVQRGEKRHPLIWNGLIHFNHDSTPVRLRNISEDGALIESSGIFPAGAELLLDLGDAGSIFSTVAWAHGDQCGLRFHAPFRIGRLADVKPDVTPARWSKPDYLRDDNSDSSPWASRWERLSLGELRQTLGR